MTTTDSALLQRNILLRISYDGTHFHGWQKQLHYGKESFRTVQGEIERALAVLHKHPVELFGSGRTDAGVHAREQVAHVDVPRVRTGSSLFYRYSADKAGEFHSCAQFCVAQGCTDYGSVLCFR